MLSIVYVVDFSETEECTVAFTLSENLPFDPVACNSKVPISITSMPYIASNIYHPTDSITLCRTNTNHEKMECAFGVS